MGLLVTARLVLRRVQAASDGAGRPCAPKPAVSVRAPLSLAPLSVCLFTSDTSAVMLTRSQCSSSVRKLGLFHMETAFFLIS